MIGLRFPTGIYGRRRDRLRAGTWSIAASLFFLCSIQPLLAQTHALASRPDLVFKSGHSSSLGAVTFSQDSALVASAGNDNRLLVWEAASGKLRWVLYGHQAPLTAIAFGPFNKLLASADQAGQVFLWNMATGRRERTTIPASRGIKALSISPDGQWLAVGDIKGIRLQNLVQPSPARRLVIPVCKDVIPLLKRMPAGVKPPPCETEKIVFTRDSKLLASAHQLGTVNVFEVATGRNLLSKKVPAHVYASGSVSSSGAEIVFGADNHLYSAGNQPGSLSVWDVTSSSELLRVKAYNVLAAAFSADGTQLAAATNPGLSDLRI